MKPNDPGNEEGLTPVQEVSPDTTENSNIIVSESEPKGNNKAISFTVFTSPQVLTKTIDILDGNLVKKPASSYVTQADLIQCSSLADVMAHLDTLTDSQAVGWGVYIKHTDTPIVVSNKRTGDEVSRTKEFFSFPNTPGVIMLDIDVEHTPDDAHATICAAYKAATGQDISDVEMYYRPSSSAGVHLPGKPPLAGGRIYMAIGRGSDIPQVGRAIYIGLWLIGRGYIHITKSGTALDRSMIDATVWSPERLDYVRPAILGSGIERVPQKVTCWNQGGKMLKAPANGLPLGEVGPEPVAQFRVIISRLRESLSDEIKAAKLAFRAAWQAKHGAGTGDAATDAIEHASLTAKFTIELANGECVSIATILANRQKYNNVQCCDPVEPIDEDGNSTYGKAKIYTNKRPIIKSFLHGGITYRLNLVDRVRQPPLPFIPADSVREISRQINAHFNDEVFITYDHKLKRIDHQGKPRPFTIGQFIVVMSDRIQQTKSEVGKQGGLVISDTNLHSKAAKDFFEMLGSEYVNLPLLRSGTNKPYLLPATGTIVSEPGYDAVTQIYLSVEHEFEPIQILTSETRAAVLETLLKPFSGFQFIGEHPNYTAAMCLAFILTAAVRRTVSSPGIAIGGSKAGIGKTELTRCIIHGMGCHARSTKHDRKNDEENKKTFATIALDPPEYVQLDNADGVFVHSTCEQLLDKPVDEPVEIRLLGVNAEVSMYNDFLLIVNGINLRAGNQAIARRLLKIELQPVEMWKRDLHDKFPNPAGYILNNWQKRHIHVLALLKDYATAGFSRVHDGVELANDYNTHRDFDKWIRGFVWHHYGVDVCTSIVEEVEDIGARDDIDGPVGRALTCCWLYAIFAETTKFDYKNVMPLFERKVTSSARFSMQAVARFVKEYELDPQGHLSVVLRNPKALKNAGLVNGLQLCKGESGGGRVVTWYVNGCPDEISNVLHFS